MVKVRHIRLVVTARHMAIMSAFIAMPTDFLQLVLYKPKLVAIEFCFLL